MGLSPFKSCGLCPTAPAPNPNPSRWVLLNKVEYKNAYVLKVKYLDATNFDGEKVMVYRGGYKPQKQLDPHFDTATSSPVARFRPDAEGWAWACLFAESL